MDQWLDSLTLEELRKYFDYWYVDDKHRVLGCFHSKVASTTWRAILCNNSWDQPKGLSRDQALGMCLKNGGPYVFKYRKSLTKEDIVHKIKTYFKFMPVRHPLDRLVSAWNDKFVHCQFADRDIDKHRKAILRQFHPWLSESQIKFSRNIYFQEFVQYIMQEGHNNHHWDGPYSRKCHPCRIDFDAIIKLETFDVDAPLIIKNKLEGKGIGTITHKRSKASWDEQYTKLLTDYKNISLQFFQKTVEKYREDFGRFGYDFHRLTDGSVKVSCGIDNGTHTCC